MVDIQPGNATDKTVVWLSSDENVATVSDDGTVTIKGEGNVTITAEAGGKNASDTFVFYKGVDPGFYFNKIENTYYIWNEDGLLAWNEYVTNTEHYVESTDANEYICYVVKTSATLMDNISLEGKSWTPVGYYDSGIEYYYAGTFDGGGHTISNLKIESSDDYDLGLFGYIATGGVVKNLTLSDVVISGVTCIGGITGNNYGTIENCNVSGSVSAGDGEAGGIAGDNWGTIENCSVSGSVSGSSYHVGGIAGYNWSTISDCSASGSIIGMYTTGGIAGGNEGKIIACHNAGDVSLEQSDGGGMFCVGGIVGNNSNWVIACYNTGNVGSGFFSYPAGGIVGDNYGEIIASYSIGDISGDYSSGGITGSIDSGTLKSNYWAKGTEGTPEFGIGNKKSNDNATEVDGDSVTWEAATSAMNIAITDWNGENNNGCGYHFEQKNAGESEPPVIAEGVPATL